MMTDQTPDHLLEEQAASFDPEYDFDPGGYPDVGEVDETPEEPSERPKPRISNFDLLTADEARQRGLTVADKAEHVKLPKPIARIVDDIFEITGDRPERVGGELFVPDALEDDGVTGRLSFPNRSAQLFAYLGTVAGKAPSFAKGGEFHTKDEVTAAVLQRATRYSSVQTLPHFPQLRDAFYHHGRIVKGDGQKLDELIRMMSPATATDRELLLAFFVTLFWGGLPGKRPAFLFTTDDGVGSGKTTAAIIGGRLAGGHIAISQSETADQIKTRLLTPGLEHVRLAVLDNVKTNRLSSADLESLITEETLSGRKLYAGDGRRPNLLTWALTLNGVSLSPDIASRVTVIKVSKPKFDQNWDERAADFVRENRRAIIGDIAKFFDRPTKQLDPAKLSRWAHWEGHIVSRLNDPDAILAELRRRREDADAEETDLVRQEIVDTLRSVSLDPEADAVFLTPKLVNAICRSALNDQRLTVTATSRTVHQWIDSKRMPDLARADRNHFGRGIVWAARSEWQNTDVVTDLETRLEQRNRY